MKLKLPRRVPMRKGMGDLLLILLAVWLGIGLLAGLPLLGIRVRSKWRNRQ